MPNAASSLSCPRCATALTAARARNVSLHGCCSCAGVWLDNASTQRIVDAFESDAIEMADRASAAAGQRSDTSRRDIPCPVCRAPMAVRNVRAAGVDVDVCASHGTWFDRDEMQQVARAMAKHRQEAFRRSSGAVATGAAVAAGVAATAGVAAVAAQPHVGHVVAQHSVTAGDVLGTAAEVAVDVAPDALEVAAGAAEVGAPLLEGVFGLVGGIFEALS
jgi:Zn-finger nucleic acid-binding protein